MARKSGRRKGYTVVPNEVLRDENLSLKAKGMFALMMALPDGWDYSIKGLASLSKDGRDGTAQAVSELEKHGYIYREKCIDSNGRFASWKYGIGGAPRTEKPCTEIPRTEKPCTEKPCTEIPSQINKEELIKEEINKEELIKELKKEYGFTVIFITHDLGVVAEVADRVAVMYSGQIVEYGKVEEIYYEPAHPYTWSLLSSLPQLGQR